MFIISLKMIEALKIPENNDSRAPNGCIVGVFLMIVC